jgi:hypothetical protein
VRRGGFRAVTAFGAYGRARWREALATGAFVCLFRVCFVSARTWRYGRCCCVAEVTLNGRKSAGAKNAASVSADSPFLRATVPRVVAIRRSRASLRSARRAKASPGADVGRSRRRCGKAAAKTWAPPFAVEEDHVQRLKDIVQKRLQM